MKKIFKLTACIILAMVVMLTQVAVIFAEDSNVSYSGNSGEFIFAPGSEYSPTDLFPNFKNVIPGDTIEQKITIKNKADNKVKVTIYLRSLGGDEDTSKNLLKKLKLNVKTESGSELFDAPIGETAELTEWTEIGTIHSGGEATLNLVLTVPTTLDNSYQNQIGKIKWEFMAVESQEDKPETGDRNSLVTWIIILAACVVVVVVVLILLKKRRKDEEKKN